MVERIGRFDIDHFGTASWSGSELQISTMLYGVPLFGDRIASVLATHRPGDILALRSGCRATLDGLYTLTSEVDVSDQGAGAAVLDEQPTPTLARWRLRRLRSAVHQTQVSAVERVSDIAWSATKKATYGVPGTYVQSDSALGTPGAVNTGNGILTTVESRVGGSIEWVVDPHRYYEGAATIWTVWGGDPATEANRIPVPGYHAPMGADVVVGNSIMELWLQAEDSTLKMRRWTGAAIGGSWTSWHEVEIYGATQDVRAWTISRNDPDRVSITAERVAGLARGGRVTAAIHRGSRHIELTISGEPYALQCPTAQNSSQSDGGGIVWLREADGIIIMGDSNGGLNPDSLSPLRTRGVPLGDHARYGLTLDDDGTQGADEWAIFGDQHSRPIWGDQ